MAAVSTHEMRMQPAPQAAAVSADSSFDVSELQQRKLMDLSGARSPDFQIVFRQTALDRVRAAAAATPENEVVGVLIGNIYADNTGPFVLVENMVPMQSERGVGRATFSQSTWQSLQAHIAKEFTNRRIVGWYYTHPKQGPTMSALDRFLHDTFFCLPWQLAMSHDPTTRQEAVFSGYKGSVQKTAFLIEYDDPSKRMVDMVGIAPAVPKKKKAKGSILAPFKMLGWLLIGIVALGIFAALGYLLGNVLLELRSTYMPHGFHF
jgi:proteasome lid subunit RPN8/RPN11